MIKMRDAHHADISNDFMLEYIQPNPLKTLVERLGSLFYETLVCFEKDIEVCCFVLFSIK